MNYSKVLKFISLSIIFFCALTSSSGQDVLNKKISIAFENTYLKNVFKELEIQADIKFAFNEEAIRNKQVSRTFEKETLKTILDEILTKSGLQYSLVGKTITVYQKNRNNNSQINAKSANKFTLSGFISDASNKEVLIGATVYEMSNGKGTVCNEYGFYSLTLPRGVYNISFSFIGYETVTKKIELNKNVDLTVNLLEGVQLEEVVVSDNSIGERHQRNQMSMNKISLKSIDELPVLMGEPDVFQLIQLKPGVSSGQEGAGLIIRGGSADQNLVLLDDVPVYNSAHLFGFISVFNGDAMQSVNVYKGGFPARYGGRLSSIVDVRMKEGNMEEFQGNVNIGLLSSKFNIEGPIIKDKTSFMFSARRTFLDLITTPIQNSIYKSETEASVSGYSFYDINAKINHKFSNKSRLYLSSFYGNDNLSLKTKYPNSETENSNQIVGEDVNDIDFGNHIIAARWNYQWSPKLFSNTVLTYSKFHNDYLYEYDSDITLFDPGTRQYGKDELSSRIEDLGAKQDFTFIPNPNHSIRFGLGYTYHKFLPTTKKTTSNEISTTSGASKIYSDEFSAYIEDDIKIGAFIRINPGVHISSFHVEDLEYTSFQPRFSLSVNTNPNMSFKASYSKMTQNIHLLVSSSIGLPTDLWVPSTAQIKPSHSHQYALGITKSLKKGYEFTLEGFYKVLENVIEYRPGQDPFGSSDSWESKVESGKGSSYGVELLAEKNLGKFRGWIAYTYSKTDRTFENINQGISFPYKYDRTHDIKIVLTHKKSEKFDYGVMWVYGTGNAYSLPSTSYYDIYGNIVNSAERNNQRMPAYHRLDLSANWHKEKHKPNRKFLKNICRTWSVGIYNAYNRQNPFILQQKDTGGSQRVLEQTSLLPFMPFVSYKLSF